MSHIEPVGINEGSILRRRHPAQRCRVRRRKGEIPLPWPEAAGFKINQREPAVRAPQKVPGVSITMDSGEGEIEPSRSSWPGILQLSKHIAEPAACLRRDRRRLDPVLDAPERT